MLSEGISLREICRQEDMPAKSSVFRWLAAHEIFRDQYARAKQAGIEALAEDILDIADDATNDWMERRDPEGQNVGWKENGEAIQRSKLRVEARKWLLAKLAPKKYGDKMALTDGEGQPLQASAPVFNVTLKGK